MRRKSMLAAVVVALSMATSSSAIGVGTGARVHWQPPKEGIVRDGATAISIARLIWFSMHPKLERSSEKAWQSGMVASLHDGVWRVQQRPLESDTIGGGLEIDISKHDGRVIAIYLTQ